MIAWRGLISSHFCIIPVRSGIEHFSRNYTAVLRFLACFPGWRCHRFRFFLFITWLGPAARAVSAPVMSSTSACCLLALSCDVIHRRHSLRLSRFAHRRLVSSPCSSCRGDGEPTGMLACFVMSCLRCGVGVAMIWMWSCSVASCRASVVLPVLLASDRNEEWDGCGEADACPMRGWRLGRHAGSFDVETAGLAA